MADVKSRRQMADGRWQMADGGVAVPCYVAFICLLASAFRSLPSAVPAICFSRPMPRPLFHLCKAVEVLYNPASHESRNFPPSRCELV